MSRPGPYFLDTVASADRRRVMRLTQGQFRHEAKALDIPSHLTPVNESVLMRVERKDRVAEERRRSRFDGADRSVAIFHGEGEFAFLCRRAHALPLAFRHAALEDEPLGAAAQS